MRNYLFILICVSIFFSGCKKITEFNIKNSTEFVVPQTGVVGVQLPTPPVETSSTYQFKSNGADTKHVQDVKLEALTLSIKSPASQTFNFLNSIRIFISADGLQEIELAYLDNIPANSLQTISLNTTGAELDEYLKKDKYSLRIKAVTDEQLMEDVTMKADMIFHVRAKL
jgi:hypothetical protein